jgi:hypothetical protein
VTLRPRLSPLLLAPLLLAACTSFVDLSDAGTRVRVAAAEADLSACTPRGEVEVSVRDQVGFYERPSAVVRDELENLARNEAVRLGADTVRPNAAPRDGVQRFNAFRCGSAAPAATRAPAAGQDSSETIPLRDDED